MLLSLCLWFPQGFTLATNPNLHIRTRYGELYSQFKADVFWWRTLLTVRKFCGVAVALMFSSTPLFQAWCVRHPQ
jgi:hypothetical protein